MAYTRLGSIGSFAALCAVPLIWGNFTAYELGLYLIYGMVGQGIALCWGRTGFLPLGQSLFFGVGAYLAGGLLNSFDNNLLTLAVILSAAILCPALLAGGLAVLVFRRQIGSGPFFSLISLALAMLGFQLANSMEDFTGGFNGMTSIPDILPAVGRYDGLYFVIVGCLALTSLGLGYLQRSPFGQLLAAVSQNEERLQYFGFDTGLLKAAVFAVSAGVAGFAGILYAAHQGIVTPQAMGFLLAAEFVIWTAVGGRMSLAGPVIGAAAIGFLASDLRSEFLYWEVVVAGVFIFVVLKQPAGMIGMVQSLQRRLGWWGEPAPRLERSTLLADTKKRRKPDLRFTGVHVTMGSVRILDGLDLEVSSNAIHCLIGPNGAGKTSAFNALAGKLPLSAGEIVWNGRSVAGMSAHKVAALGISRKFQIPSVFPALSIRQNIDIAIWANRLRPMQLFSMSPFRWKTSLLGRLEERFPILKDASKLTGELSVGQRQLLDFSLTMLTEPDLALLDEPCAGLSVAEAAEMTQAISQIVMELGAAGIVIEHDMQVVERLSDRVHVLHQGRLLASGRMADIRNDPAVQAVYAGGGRG